MKFKPYPPREEQRCENCYYSVFMPELGSVPEHRECRANAPVASDRYGNTAWWPQVAGGDWCGNWGRINDEDEEDLL